MNSLRYFHSPQIKRTPLLTAVSANTYALYGEGNERYVLPFVELLINAGADINALDEVGCLGPGMSII